MAIELRFPGTHQPDQTHPIYSFYRLTVWDLELRWDQQWQIDIQREVSRDDVWAPGYFPTRCYYTGDDDHILEICNSLASHKDHILAQINQHQPDLFNVRWPRGLDYYKKNSRMQTAVFRDSPGFYIPPHVDNQHIIVQAIVNLVDNGDVGTEFHTVLNPAAWYRTSGIAGLGSMFVNGPGGIHSIKNGSQNRYVLYTTIEFG